MIHLTYPSLTLVPIAINFCLTPWVSNENDKKEGELNAVFYSGSTARTSYLNMYVHGEANIGFPTEIDAFFCY